MLRLRDNSWEPQLGSEVKVTSADEVTFAALRLESTPFM